MEILAILIPLSLVLVLAWVVMYIWSVRNGQFDDLEHEATKILFEEDTMEPKTETKMSDNK